MKIQEELAKLLFYYEATRNVGHTTLMKKGTDNYDGQKYVLTINMNHGTEMNLDSKEIISLQNLDKLRGSSRPIAIDNETMRVILAETLKEFDKLEKENQELNDKINLIRKIIK